MSGDAIDPIAAAPRPPPSPPRRRVTRWLVGSLLFVALTAAVGIAVVAWAVRSASGSAWLLSWVPGVTVVAPQGALLGDFAAERVDVALDAHGGLVRIERPAWRALAARAGDHGRWLHLTLATLRADRVTIVSGRAPAAPAANASSLPASLRLPLEIEIGEAQVGELRFGEQAGAFALHELRGRVHLGDDGGARHRFAALTGRYQQATANGEATIASDAPFDTQARLDLVSAGGSPAWTASARGTGPLEALTVAVSARVAGVPSRPAQSLDAQAVVKPFAPWPLGELRATTEALDLSAFSTSAPATSLSGHATATTTAADQPAMVSIELSNARAGRWSARLLPVQRLSAELRARPDDPGTIDVQTLLAELGSAGQPGGRIAGRGRWTADRWNLDVELRRLQPSALDARAPDTALDGTVSAAGSGFASTTPGAAKVELKAELAGQLADARWPKAAPRAARLRLEATAGAHVIEIKTADASLADAKASLTGRLERSADDAPWHATGKAALSRFDPAPWWPGSVDALLARGANLLNADAAFDLQLPAATGGSTSTFALLASTRGTASLNIADSVVAGVPLQGQGAFIGADGTARPSFDLLAGGNRVKAEGRIGSDGRQDSWQLAIDAPQLARLAPLLQPAGTSAAKAPVVAGTLAATGRIDGRWPELTSSGELQGASLRYGSSSVRRAEGQWKLGSAADAVASGTLLFDGIDLGGRAIERARATVSGTGKAHQAELRIESAALPPEWVDTVAAVTSAARSASGPASTSTTTTTASVASPASAASATAAASSGAARGDAAAPAGVRSLVVVRVEGGFVDAGGERAAGWTGTVREALAQGLAAPAPVWLRARDLRGSVFWGGGPSRATLEQGSAEALGSTLRWGRIAWQAGDASGAARLDASASVDPIAVAPILRAMQPGFGWGGDLTVRARLEVHGAPRVTVDAAIERAGGDLDVTDEYGTQKLGLAELRFGIGAKDGVWRFETAVSGSDLGAVDGSVTARTGSAASWPDAQTPIDGALRLKVANLGTWGRWVPAGWRLTGALDGNARVGGRFGAPEYTGRLEGNELGVRNFLQGVNVHDGRIAVALQGATAKIERFTAKAGEGTVTLEGDATFEDAPAVRLALKADRFQVLGRVDRRIVASGDGNLHLDAKTFAVDGKFQIDEGLIDFTRSDAPTLGDDVEVIRRPAGAPAPVVPGTTPVIASAAAASSASPSAVPVVVPLAPMPPAARQVALDLRVAMGEKLRVRGRGLDTRLRGELRITSPGGRLAVDGSLQAYRGTYQAYGQKLGIDRGVLTFVGPIENPRLDIEATRPNLDVRVGVIVAGTALNPRIRLFSEPEMSDLDKLSWLVLGRANEGVGRNDTALLQRAALALLAGEGPGMTDKLIQAIGLDDVSVRQEQTGDVKDTIVSLGKQISKNWYVGYERGLNATTGSWQLIYRVARRLTVRAQAGGDNSLDLIWTLRWR